MKYNINKSALIEEAVHANHSHLDKRNAGTKDSRNELSATINKLRGGRDYYRVDTKHPNGSQNYASSVNPQGYETNQAKANVYDNQARASSQQGTDAVLSIAKEFDNLRSGHRNIGKANAAYMASAGYPRVISSAKQ